MDTIKQLLYHIVLMLQKQTINGDELLNGVYSIIKRGLKIFLIEISLIDQSN